MVIHEPYLLWVLCKKIRKGKKVEAREGSQEVVLVIVVIICDLLDNLSGFPVQHLKVVHLVQTHHNQILAFPVLSNHFHIPFLKVFLILVLANFELLPYRPDLSEHKSVIYDSQCVFPAMGGQYLVDKVCELVALDYLESLRRDDFDLSKPCAYYHQVILIQFGQLQGSINHFKAVYSVHSERVKVTDFFVLQAAEQVT